MSDWSALHPLRIGCVQYLNAKPLIAAYDGEVLFDHPSVLAEEIARGNLDAGLVPIYEALQAPNYSIVDGVAIASDGPVFSVFLAHRAPLRDVQRVELDSGSLTSVHLLKVLLKEYHGLHPQFFESGSSSNDADAQLLIGNQAIDFRFSHADTHQFLDLGMEWKRCTGHPFVFAVWLLRPGLKQTARVADTFRALQREGLRRIPNLVENETFRDREFRQDYLTRHIRFGMGSREKEGIEKFRSLLVNHGYVAANGVPLKYV